MTEITIYKSKNQYTGFSCMGHAGYDEFSRDIVCASISILVINTINSIEMYTKDIDKVKSDEDLGIIKCFFKPCISSDSTILMKSMILGLTKIQEQYGKTYIDLKFEEV